MPAKELKPKGIIVASIVKDVSVITPFGPMHEILATITLSNNKVKRETLTVTEEQYETIMKEGYYYP